MAYEWSTRPGLIRYYYHHDRRPDTKTDILSVGLITPLDNAVLLRVDSEESNDYLELEMVSYVTMRIRLKEAFWRVLLRSGFRSATSPCAVCLSKKRSLCPNLLHCEIFILSISFTVSGCRKHLRELQFGH